MRECIICGQANQVRPYCTVQAMHYRKCDACDLIFVDPLPDAATLYPSYSGGAWKSLRRKFMAPFRGFRHVRNFEQSMQRARQIFKFVAVWVQSGGQPPALLDIGCNKGFLLAAAIEQHWNVHGIELIPELTIAFRREYKCFAHQVHSGRFCDRQHLFADASLDAVTAIDVIEHFEDPVADGRNICRILRPGGIFVLQTPDGRCSNALEQGEKWGALKPLEHLHIFSRKNLRKFAELVGFREVHFYAPFEQADGNLVAVMKK